MSVSESLARKNLESVMDSIVFTQAISDALDDVVEDMILKIPRWRRRKWMRGFLKKREVK